jgi:hypothetical protein
MGNLIDGAHIESNVVPRRWHSDSEFASPAARDDGEIFGDGEPDDFRGLLGVGRFDGDTRGYFIHGVGCELERVSVDALGVE